MIEYLNALQNEPHQVQITLNDDDDDDDDDTEILEQNQSQMDARDSSNELWTKETQRKQRQFKILMKQCKMMKQFALYKLQSEFRVLSFAIAEMKERGMQIPENVTNSDLFKTQRSEFYKQMYHNFKLEFTTKQEKFRQKQTQRRIAITNVVHTTEPIQQVTTNGLNAETEQMMHSRVIKDQNGQNSSKFTALNLPFTFQANKNSGGGMTETQIEQMRQMQIQYHKMRMQVYQDEIQKQAQSQVNRNLRSNLNSTEVSKTGNNSTYPFNPTIEFEIGFLG